MNEDRTIEPGERLKNILSADKEEENTPPKPMSQSQSQSPLEQLPRLKPASQTPPTPGEKNGLPKLVTPAYPAKPSKSPQSKQSTQNEQQPLDEQQVSRAQAMIPPTKPDLPRREKILRALWTVASVFSMLLNIVLIIILVVVFWAYRDIKVPESVDITMVNELLSGLYSNFEKMDRATIETVIPVDAQIPLDITVPVQTTTQITLSETVSIPNAQVVINTGGLNINSNARVTLPAGTPLMVNLDFDLPVRDTIPVHLEVPVKIPMANTELHEPFVGLQDVVRPLYCLVDSNATGLDTQLICR